MRAASVLLLFGICALSASIPHSTFRYQLHTSLRRAEDCCQMCYGDDCMNLGEARCQYYASADEILDKEEDDGEVTEIDGMMYDLTEQAAMSWTVKQCVPLISWYTDCTKDNVCIGCNVCTCTSAGEWSCSVVSRCRPDATEDADHGTLVMVMEKLMEGHKTTRKKRSVNNVTDKVAVKPVGYVDIAEWMYGVKPNTHEDFPFSDVETDNFIIALVDQTDTFLTQTQSTIHLSNQTEPENIDFEEVLRNIASDDQNNKARKSQLIPNDNTAYNYMDLENKKYMSSNPSDQFIQFLNDIEEGKEVTGSVDDAIVNLMQRDNYYNDDINATDNIMINNMDKEEKNKIDANDIILEKVNVMKRDVSSVIDLNNTIHVTSRTPADIITDTVNIIKRELLSVTELNNTTQAPSVPTAPFETTKNKLNDIENNVLIPITRIIDEKNDEIKQLLQIRENLVKCIYTYNSTGVNITGTPEIINSSSTYFSIYKLDLFPEIQENLRSTNSNLLEKISYKLKRDIYEVLRDITKIQKFSNTNGLPVDLKMLISTMKYYVHEQGNYRNLQKKKIDIEKQKNSRRVFSSPTSIAEVSSNSINKQMFDILEVLDKDKTQSNALEPLSKSIKKIMKRVIKQHDDFINFGLRVHDPSYNLMDDLRMIGKKWPEFTAYVASSPLYDNIYAMKLLHFSLAEDINRITNAIYLVKFAHSRRMTPLETPIADELMEKINSGLILIKNKVDILLKYQKQSKIINIKATRKMKKDSFFDKLRNLLRNSKKEVISLINKDVPKSEIVRRIAEKKLDELTLKKMSTYEQTMLKWQKKIKTARRKKRQLESQSNNIKQLSMIKNIIPKYLQGKINPALVKNGNTKSIQAQ